LWLAAETSQQPISQTTWLKVTPHCNHCNHYKAHKKGLQLRRATARLLISNKQSVLGGKNKAEVYGKTAETNGLTVLQLLLEDIRLCQTSTAERI
jgi:hypothetical protein